VSPTGPPNSSSARTPFQTVRADAAVALAFGVAAIVWATIDTLPGGRWMPVHLFTLGVLTPLIVAFSQRQLHTLFRTPPLRMALVRALLWSGAGLVVAGMAQPGAGWARAAIAIGATASAAGVARATWALHRTRRRQRDDVRFGWMLRSYERAHLAFLLGAGLGAALGMGLVPGGWYVAFRHAHLHALVVGFAAVTLLATVVLFGPMLLRAQIAPDGEVAAARWLPRIVLGTGVAVLGLLGQGLPAQAAVAARWLAAAGLIVITAGALTILRPLVAIVRRKGNDAPLTGVLLTFAIGWLTLALVADAVVVATGSWRLLDAVGLLALLGGFAQAITATLLHVATMWLPRQRRLRLYPRLDAVPLWVAAAPQVLLVWLALRLLS